MSKREPIFSENMVVGSLYRALLDGVNTVLTWRNADGTYGALDLARGAGSSEGIDPARIQSVMACAAVALDDMMEVPDALVESALPVLVMDQCREAWGRAAGADPA